MSPSLAAFGRPELTLTPLFLRCITVPDPDPDPDPDPCCFRVLLGDCQKQNNAGDLGDSPSSSISSPTGHRLGVDRIMGEESNMREK